MNYDQLDSLIKELKTLINESIPLNEYLSLKELLNTKEYQNLRNEIEYYKECPSFNNDSNNIINDDNNSSSFNEIYLKKKADYENKYEIKRFKELEEEINTFYYSLKEYLKIK